ncbi:hypothetical protein [Ruminococcus callidus]|uniref:hypothetical protein n=1 Tax=Ruminococcus callidus TaxID=40519 RepID=UPI003521A274
MWNLLLGVKDLCSNPSVSLRLPAQHKARPAGAFSGEPDRKKASLEKGGGPSLDGGGILTWNLLHNQIIIYHSTLSERSKNIHEKVS